MVFLSPPTTYGLPKGVRVGASRSDQDRGRPGREALARGVSKPDRHLQRGARRVQVLFQRTDSGTAGTFYDVSESPSGPRLHRDEIAGAHLKKIVIPYKIKPDFLDGTAPDEHRRGRAVPGSRRLGRSIADLTSLGMQHRPHARAEYQLAAYLRSPRGRVRSCLK